MAAEKERGAVSASAEIGKYLDILAKDPTSRVFAPLAEAYRKAGLLDDAIETVLEGLKVHPNYLGGRVALGRAYFEKRQYAEAAAEMQKVVKAAPDNLMAHKVLGQIAYGQSDLATAEKAFKMVLLLDPRDQEAQQFLANIGGAGPSSRIAPEAPLAADRQPVAPRPAMPAPSPPPPAAGEPVDDLAIEDISLDSPIPEPAPRAPAAPQPQPQEGGEGTFELPAIELAEEEIEPPPGSRAQAESAPPPPALEIGWEPEPPAATATSASAATPLAPPAMELEIFARRPWGMEQAGEPAAAPVTPTPTPTPGQAQEQEQRAPEPVAPAPAASLPEESPFEVFGRAKRETAAPSGKGEREAYAEIELEPTSHAPVEAAEEQTAGDSPFEVFTRERREAGPSRTAPRPGHGEGSSFREIEIETTGFIPEASQVGDFTEASGPAPGPDLQAPGEPEADLSLEEELPHIDLAREVEQEAAAPEPAAVESGREEEPAAQRGVFDTETLAAIYIDQGFYGRALEIYQRLLGQRPGDPGLLQRIEEVRALEQMQQGKGAAPAGSAGSAAPAASPAAAGGGPDERIRRLQTLLEAFRGGSPQ